MRFIRDLLPILRRHDITFERRNQEAGDIYTFVFRGEDAIRWKAGQHGLFTVTHKKIKRSFRPFSLASTGADGTIEIATRIGKNPSEYKQALLEMEPGTQMSLRGPFGGFYLKNNHPALFIAGGIGITPFSSMVRDIRSGSNFVPDKTKLLYIDSKHHFIYKDLFQEVNGTKGISIDYLTQREVLAEEILKFVQAYGNKAQYFIAGSPEMTKDIAARLKENGIQRGNIVTDAFFGY